MRLLMISTDRKIFDKESAVAKRQIEYAKDFEEVHIVIFANRNFKEFSLSPNLWVYPTKSLSKLLYPFDAIKLGRFLIEKRKITHVTCQDPFETGLVGASLKKRHDINLEIQIHTDIGSPAFQNFNLKNKIRTIIAKTTLLRADNIRVVSKRIADYVKKIVPKENIDKIIEIRPIQVDIEKIKNTPITIDLKKEFPGKKILLSVCRLEPEKRVDMMINAIKGKENVQLIIVGDGSLKKDLENLAKNLPVKFYGWRSDTASFYKTADVFLNTSLYEGYGMTFVEASAVGLPIISTDVGIAREVGATIVESVDDIFKNL